VRGEEAGVKPELLAYGLGRLAFGAGLMAAPSAVGALFVGDEAKEPAVRISIRTYGTRDVILGAGTLRAVAAGGDDVAPWLAAGIAADLLDAAIQLGEWGDLPPGRRAAGAASALAAAATGVALLARASALNA
jgi:hypothetical protein